MTPLFSDSDFVDSILKEKQIVLLGEMDHGDGTSFLIKTQLIKYLNEKHGFNTLAFEASTINCDILWNNLTPAADVHQLSKENIFYIWSQVKETRDLFNWIAEKKKKNNPIKIIGIDPQFSGTNKADGFINLLKKSLPIELTEYNDFKIFEFELRLVSTWTQYPKGKQHKITEKKFMALTDFYKNETLKTAAAHKKKIWEIYFENIKLHATIKWLRKEGSFEKRDQQMFNNLKYHLDKNKENKIIVWAANAHIIRKDHQLKEGKPKWLGIKKLGDHIFEHYPNKTYSIGFTAGRGKTLNWYDVPKTDKIKKPKKHSFEHSFSSFDNIFVDLKLYEQKEQNTIYESQLVYTNAKRTAQWSNHFDGVIFIKNMRPSTHLW